ncbi:2'-5' RNA ligase family protein [Novosphingobium sp. HR1a]|nr:2'-5' RNA ligase family protein [Novosphingobium sp. HR1a]
MPQIPRMALIAALVTAYPSQAEDRLSIDIYAIPSPSIVDAVTEASVDLAARGMTTFHAQGHPAHVTLYLTQYPASAAPALKAAVAKAAKACRSFPLTVTGLQRTASNWLFLKVERSAPLQRLADEMTLAAEPLRSHDLAPPSWMKEYPAKLPAFERYGSPNVFMQFDPHLTLLANEANPDLGKYMADVASRPPRAEGGVTGIGLGIVDANGQLVRTLAEYRCKA